MKQECLQLSFEHMLK